MRQWQTKRSATGTFGPIFVPVVGLHLLRVQWVDLRSNYLEVPLSTRRVP